MNKLTIALIAFTHLAIGCTEDDPSPNPQMTATGAGGALGVGGGSSDGGSGATGGAGGASDGAGGAGGAGGSGSTAEFSCTEVIGFSQTINWYRGDDSRFEATVADEQKWQLRAQPGADLKLWVSPDSTLWTTVPVTSACASGGDAFGADRVIFTISSDLGANVSGDPNGEDWVSYITQAVDTLRMKFTNARQIVLQPVVGGTEDNGDTCTSGDAEVRASFQHPYIVEAIDMVVAADTVPDAEMGSLRVGFAPTTPDCSYFVDAKGHLGGGVGAGEIGASIAQAYGTP